MSIHFVQKRTNNVTNMYYNVQPANEGKQKCVQLLLHFARASFRRCGILYPSAAAKFYFILIIMMRGCI